MEYNSPFVNLFFELDDKPFQFNTIWHYTNAAGLTGIIKNETIDNSPIHFWFTRSDCLNDYSEGEEIKELFVSESYQCWIDGCITETFYRIIIQQAQISKNTAKIRLELNKETTELTVLGNLDEWTAYICCFSFSEDSLDMWRYYSKNSGGYGIKLHTFNVDEQLKLTDVDPFKYNIDVKYYKVLYDEGEKREFIRAQILSAYQAFLKEGGNKEAAEKACFYLRYALSSFQYRFKNACFKNENEFRCVCFIRNDAPETIKQMFTVKYRVSNGAIIPYLDIAFQRKNALISEIMISPFLKDGFAKKTTIDYLCKCGLTDCRVTQSKLPVRF